VGARCVDLPRRELTLRLARREAWGLWA
jgi:hypothetical protein